jgi:hypothetical protein
MADPNHDILFEDIGVCPIDDHSTYGVYAGEATPSQKDLDNLGRTRNLATNILETIILTLLS